MWPFARPLLPSVQGWAPREQYRLDMKRSVKIDNRRLAAAVVLSLVAHATLLLAVGAPSASGSGAAGTGMEVVIGAPGATAPKARESAAIPNDRPDAKADPDVKGDRESQPDRTPTKAEDRKPPAPTPVDIKEPEPKQPAPKPIEIKEPELKQTAPKPVEVKKPEPKQPAPKPVDVRKPVPEKSPPVRVAEKKPEATPAKSKPSPPKPPVVRKGTGAKPPRAPRRATARSARAKSARTKPERAKSAAAKRQPTQTAALRPADDGNDDSGTGRGTGVVPIMRSPRFGRPPSPAAYPRLSVHREEEGTVIVRALVHRRGTPAEVRVWRSSGYPRLDHAALQAVRRWVFLPMQRGGRAVAAWVEIPVRFRLQ